MAKANVTIIEAQMGEGKTLTATAIIIDEYFAHIYEIVSPRGTVFQVKPSCLEEVWLQPPPELQGKAEPFLITIPKGWKTHSTVKIFANYHLFGIEYIYADPALMLTYLNTELISDGILIIDESYIQGEARRGMNTLSLMYTWFAQQMRKRHIDLYLLVQHGRFIDWRFRYIAKRKILCRYNDETHKIKLLIQNLSKGTEKMLSYYGPTYWKYYDTNELPPIPETMIQRAGASV